MPQPASPGDDRDTNGPDGPDRPPSRAERRAERRKGRSRARRIVGRLLTGLVTLVVLIVLVVVVGVATFYYQGTRSPGGQGQYVALGSSFAAGPGVGTRAPDSPTLCARSEQNYAHLLAAKRQLDLTDVTCSAATAQHVLHGGQYFQPPQLDALRPSTELVTVTVGGNDISYLGNLSAESCRNDPGAISVIWRALSCTPTADATVDAQLAVLPDAMRQIAQEVQRRSPRASLVFVDYTTVLPDSGSCPDRLPISAAVLDRSRYLARRLAAITADTARSTGSLLVQASVVTHGHDVCSSDPWVAGFTYAPTPLNYGSPAYHPTMVAMTHIADAIDRTLPAQR